jgi:hypothetical protein
VSGRTTREDDVERRVLFLQGIDDVLDLVGHLERYRVGYHAAQAHEALPGRS